MTKVTILGDGAWGTALACLLDRKGEDVILWSAFPEYVEVLREKHENVKFLPGIPLAKTIEFSSDLTDSVCKNEVIVFAIPTQYLRNVLYKMKGDEFTGKIIVSVAKGIEKNTLMRPSEVIVSKVKNARLAVLSGPSHAIEVARNMPTCAVIASKDRALAKQAQRVFMDGNFRVYTSEDIVGVELGGALKNVIAIAAGICDGLQFGSNAKAALLTRGLLEITRLGVRLGANPNTFFGLSGLGDLVTTCISESGRNRRVGQQVGEGKPIEDVLAGMQSVVEGVETTRSVIALAERQNLEMPIAREIYRVLFEKKDPRHAVGDLMLRDAKMELE